MKNLTIHVAVLGTLGLASMHVSATGFVNLPATGFSVSGGTSAYTLCNTTGNFGWGLSSKPTISTNNTCAVFPANEATAPDSNYTGISAFPIASNSRDIVMNNTYTDFTNKTIGRLTQYVWRRAAESDYECIYGTKIVLAGNSLEVTDIALGGFDGLDIDVAYSSIPAIANPIYRVGRTFTGVQYNVTGSLSQPPTTPPYSLSINTAQSASINENWVNFTTSASWPSDYASSMVYIRTSCSNSSPALTSNAVRLRQTRNGPLIEVSVPGLVPVGSLVTPVPVSPY